MSQTVLITDCDMGPADLERSVLEPAGWRIVHGSARTEEDVVAAVSETGAAGLLVQYAPISAQVLEPAPPSEGWRAMASAWTTWTWRRRPNGVSQR